VKILLNRGVSVAELEQINGTGKDGRVTKNDILEYVKNRVSQLLSPAKL
jgi:2-oxoglutarate dehydrogenase E2 component (dihydrolipoamide succinyltransferase)